MLIALGVVAGLFIGQFLAIILDRWRCRLWFPRLYGLIYESKDRK